MTLLTEHWDLTARFLRGPERKTKWRTSLLEFNKSSSVKTFIFPLNQGLLISSLPYTCKSLPKMALLKLFQENTYKRMTEIFRISSNFFRNSSDFTHKVLEDIQEARKEDDMPVEIENPFTSEKPKCILCKYDIEPDFRNVRLLSQFVSSFTGRVYGRHITGLCEQKHKKVEECIKKAQISGLMGFYVKNPKFLADPDLYDTSKPFKVF